MTDARIPQVFHQVWLGSAPMPPDFVAYRESWKAHHPAWEVKLWTEKEIDWLSGHYLFEHARTISTKSDVLRFEILARHGGVYVDTDFECLRSIEGLIAGCECFVGCEDPWTASGAIMGGAPGHPLFLEAARLLRKNCDIYGPPEIVAGPQFLTRLVRNRSDVTLFPPQVFYPTYYNDRRRTYPLAKAYGNHHWGKSWGHRSPLIAFYWKLRRVWARCTRGRPLLPPVA